MNVIKRNFRLLLFTLTFPMLGVLYPLLNRPGIRTYSLVTDFDVSLPFVKSFVIPYIAWYPFILLTLAYLLIKDRKIFLNVIAILDICLLLAFSTYVVYQTTVPRPILAGDDMLTNLVRSIYSGDRPYNCFPSLHVIETYILMKAMAASESKGKALNLIVQTLGTLIILSTFFIKQHVILDAVYGIVLVELVFNVVYRYQSGCTVQWGSSQFSKAVAGESVEI